MPTPIKVKIPKNVDLSSPAAISEYIRRAQQKDDSEAKWSKYYQKLNKYRNDLEEGFRRHPNLKYFLNRERKRYISYVQHRPDRIEKLQSIPGFTWTDTNSNNNDNTVEENAKVGSDTTTDLPSHDTRTYNDAQTMTDMDEGLHIMASLDLETQPPPPLIHQPAEEENITMYSVVKLESDTTELPTHETNSEESPPPAIMKEETHSDEDSRSSNSNDGPDEVVSDPAQNQQSETRHDDDDDESIQDDTQLDNDDDDQSSTDEEDDALVLLKGLNKLENADSSPMIDDDSDSDEASASTMNSEQRSLSTNQIDTQPSETKMNEDRDDINNNSLEPDDQSTDKEDNSDGASASDTNSEQRERALATSQIPSQPPETKLREGSDDINANFEPDNLPTDKGDNYLVLLKDQGDTVESTYKGKNKEKSLSDQSISSSSSQVKSNTAEVNSSNKSNRIRRRTRSMASVSPPRNEEAKKADKKESVTVASTSAVAKRTRSKLSNRSPSDEQDEISSPKTRSRKRAKTTPEKQNEENIADGKNHVKTPKNVENELETLRNYYQDNLASRQKGKSFYYGILQRDSSSDARKIKKLCKKRRYDLNTGVSKGLFSRTLSALLKEKLAELYDHLVQQIDDEKSVAFRDISLDEKVSNLIGNHGGKTNLDMFYDNINEQTSDLRKFYMAHISDANRDSSWFRSILMDDFSEQGSQLKSFCRDRRKYFNNIFSGKKHSGDYFQKLVQTFVDLYDDLERSASASNQRIDETEEMEDFDKVTSLIGTIEDGRVSFQWYKASADIRSLENYYVENISSKEQTETWYNSVLMKDTSEGAYLLKEWCRGKRYTIFSDSGQKLNESPYTKMLQEALVELHDKLEKRSDSCEEMNESKSDTEKIWSLIGAFRLDKDNFKVRENEKYVHKLKLFFENNIEYKTTENTWFYGVLLNNKMEETSRLQDLKHWCYHQRTFLKKFIEGEEQIQANDALKWKVQLLANLFDDLEQTFVQREGKKSGKKSLRDKIIDLVGVPETSSETPVLKNIQNECDQLRLYYIDNLWRKENEGSAFFELLAQDRSNQATALKRICHNRRTHFKKAISENRSDDRFFPAAMKFYEDLYDELVKQTKGLRNRQKNQMSSTINTIEKVFNILGSGKISDVDHDSDF